MICINCHETMEGDGYYYCPYIEDYSWLDYYEPDADPVYCNFKE